MDCWAAWLLNRRQGGTELTAEMLEQLRMTRDRVIAAARLDEGMILLDVGCGDGLIGLEAASRVGPRGQVILSDISEDLLAECRRAADSAGLLDRCRFAQTSAEDLAGIDDASVDAVTTRSVLIYVADKARAFAQFHRVLKRGGRLSIFEPINQFTCALESPTDYAGYDLAPVGDLLVKTRAVFDRVEAPRIGPMLDFGERDLFLMARQAGFGDVHMNFEAYTERTPPQDWLSFYNSSGNPLAPTLAEAVEESLDEVERERFVACIRPLVEGGRGELRRAAVYLNAIRDRD